MHAVPISFVCGGGAPLFNAGMLPSRTVMTQLFWRGDKYLDMYDKTLIGSGVVYDAVLYRCRPSEGALSLQ